MNLQNPAPLFSQGQASSSSEKLLQTVHKTKKQKSVLKNTAWYVGRALQEN